MSAVYDNWERLVGAVLSRDDLRRSGMRTPSEISSLSARSSFSFVSPFDLAVNSPSFTYGQILQATDSLSRSNLISYGVSGEFYHGVLEEGGVPVVVKKVNSEQLSFLKSEMDFFARVSHPKLVPLVGYCMENRNHKFVVYEYMAKGDLFSCLCRNREIVAEGQSQPLDWKSRLKVAIGAAQALCHLHHECVPPLVHRNVKASSILITTNYDGCLGRVTGVCTEKKDRKQNIISKLLRFPRGSGQGASDSSKATCACDVYCFGIVLLQLVTGFPVLRDDKSLAPNSLENILPYITTYDGELIRIILDPCLIKDGHLFNEMWEVAVVAKACLILEPSKRPLMKNILKTIEDFELEDFVAYVGSPSSNQLAYVGSPSNSQLTYVGSPSDSQLTYVGSPSDSQLTYVGSPSNSQLTNVGSPSDSQLTNVGSPSDSQLTYVGSPSNSQLTGIPEGSEAGSSENTSNAISGDRWDSLWNSGDLPLSENEEVYRKLKIWDVPNLKVFEFAQLKAATENFRRDSLLGEGGFGTVYKGCLPKSASDSDRESLIAVKRWRPESLQGLEEWQTEIKMLGSLSHPNLIKLHGYCFEDEELVLVYEYMPKGSLHNHLFGRGSNIQPLSCYQQYLTEIKMLGSLSHPNLIKLHGYCFEDEELVLVYEYMPKGSLHNHLFGRGSNIQPLSWDIRLKVLVGAAQGLAYLHALKREVIFRDFKTSSIILDSFYNPKLSDFGLAKMGPPENETHITTSVKGTYGYADPEYVATGHLYVKSDVYGFGVVMVEVLTGLRIYDQSRSERQRYLVDWIKPYLSDKRQIKKIMDSHLEGKYSVKGAAKMAQLALTCLEPKPKNRPSMKQVLETLLGIGSSLERERS